MPKHTDPPYKSSMSKKKNVRSYRYETTIPKPVAELMEKKANSTWKVTFKFEEEDKIKVYWEPLDKE